MIKKYYFDQTSILKKYDTVWYGFIVFSENINKEQYLSEWIDITCEILDVDFYYQVEQKTLYISLDNDGYYLYTSKLEKNIREWIKRMESLMNCTSVSGELNAIEYQPMGSQFRYYLTKINDEIIIKKKTLGWK